MNKSITHRPVPTARENFPYWVRQMFRGALGGIVGAYIGAYIWVVLKGFSDEGPLVVVYAFVGAFFAFIYPLVLSVLFGASFGMAEGLTHKTKKKTGVIWYLLLPLIIGILYTIPYPHEFGWIWFSIYIGMPVASIRVFEQAFNKILHPVFAAAICGVSILFLLYLFGDVKDLSFDDFALPIGIIVFMIILFQRIKGGIKNEQ